jgi:hypothetical protein
MHQLDCPNVVEPYPKSVGRIQNFVGENGYGLPYKS